MVTVDIVDLTKESDEVAETQLDSNIKGSDTYLSNSDDSLIDEQMSSRYGIALCRTAYSLFLYSESSGCCDIVYFNNDSALPIFSCQSRQWTSSLHTVTSILDTSKDFVCSKHPTQIDTNCTFVVDSSKLLDPDDIKCDDCGVWKQTKTATTTLHIDFF